MLPESGTGSGPDGLKLHAETVLELDRVREMVARRAASDLGRRLAGALAPLGGVEPARARLEESAELARLFRAGERLPLQGLGDPAALVRASAEKGRPLEGPALLAIANAARCGTALGKALSALGGDFPRLRALGAEVPSLPDLELALATAIDDRGEVRSSASGRLRALRDEIEGLRQRIDARIAGLVETPAYRPFLQSSKPTFRNGRYVVAVKAQHHRDIPGILHDKSQTERTFFVEPTELVSIGNELSDRIFEERDEVTRILWELTQQTYGFRAALERLSAALGAIDVAQAKARLALDLGLVAPEVVDPADGALDLRDARHPLLVELARRRPDPAPPVGPPGEDERGRRSGGPPSNPEEGGRPVIPISLRLGDDFDIVVVTGPNAGGKTVALKSVGLLALMAASGIPVPAAPGSRVPIFSSVFADIGDEQAIEHDLSTFSAHVVALRDIVERADRRSLVLIDELGSGTDPEEGAALGAAVLERLGERGARVIVTTHLGALKTFAYTHPRVENGAVEFDPETLRPTYRLVLGQPGNSHAMLISRRLGLPEAIVARAEGLAGRPGEAKDLIDRIQELRYRAERDRESALERLGEAETVRADAVAEREAAGRDRRTLAREADAEVEALYGRLRAALKAGLEDLRGAPPAVLERLRGLELRLLDTLARTPFVERRRDFARRLKKGSRVYVVPFEREGVVTRINKEKERLTVRLGEVAVETDFESVTWLRGGAGDGAPP